MPKLPKLLRTRFRARRASARRQRRPLFESLENRHLLAAVTGLVFVDHNVNFVKEPNEPWSVGSTVFLDQNQNGVFDTGEPSQVTNTSGRYTFNILTPGTYHVRLRDEVDFQQISPVAHRTDNTLIDVSNSRGHVFDPRRGLYYIATADGTIERYDVASRTLLEPFHVGASLADIDITPDASFLVVTENAPGATQGFVRKVDLSDGTVTNFAYDRVSLEVGAFDVAVTNDNRAVVTTDFAGSGFNPVRFLNLGTGAFESQGSVRGHTHLGRSADRDFIVLGQSNISSGPISVYHVPTGVMSSPVSTLLNIQNVAANHDGSRFAVAGTGQLRLYDDMLNLIGQDIRMIFSGVAFDPVRDVLYVGDTSTDEIVALNGSNLAELYRINVGADLTVGERYLSVSSDGQFLLVGTPGGVRMLTVGAPDSNIVVVQEDTTSVFGPGFTLQETEFAPLVADDQALVETDSASNPIFVLANDQLRSAGTLTVTSLTPPALGQVVIDGSGTHVLYQPLPGFIGIETFEYTVSDSQGREETATVTVAVKPLDGMGVISGRLWQEMQGNGRFDPIIDVPHFGPGWGAYLDLNDNRIHEMGEPIAPTDPQGRYAFVMPPGQYTVRRLGSPEFKQWNNREGVRQSFFLDSPLAHDHVFDPRRGLLYISTSDGWIQRYDVVRAEFIEPWHVGISLAGIDRDEQAEFLYVAEAQYGTTAGYVRKIDLDDGTVTNIAYDRQALEEGAWDVGGTSSHMFFSTQVSGSGDVPLREITPPGDMVQDRVLVRQNTQFAEAGDSSLLFLTEPNASDGPISTIDLASGQISPKLETNFFLSGASSSVSRDGSLIALQAIPQTVSVLEGSFPLNGQVKEILPVTAGGIAFDPSRPVLYVGHQQTGPTAPDQIVAYDTNMYRELFRIDVPEGLLDTNAKMSVSEDGQLLFVSVQSGVRMFDLMNVLPYRVTVGPDEFVENIDFELNFPIERAVPANDAFTARNTGITITLDVLANDLGLRPLRIVDVNTVPTQGTVEISADGRRIHYTPAPGFVGTDQFVYYTDDGLGDILGGAQVTITVDGPSMALVRGIVWDDLDGDGEFEPLDGENPLGGMPVFLDVNENGQAEPEEIVVTNSQGEYDFLLPAGTYQIGQLDPAGWSVTTPLKPGSENVLIPVPTARGHVFDPQRNLHYMATSEGNVERFDIATQTLLTPLDISNELRPIDIYPTGEFLLVGDARTDNGQGFVHLVHLPDGTIETFPFALEMQEQGVFDLALTQTASALVTTRFQGSGRTPLRQLLFDGTYLTLNTGYQSGEVRQDTRLAASADDLLVFMTESNISSGPIRSYHSVTDSFSITEEAQDFLDDVNSAVNADGSLIATGAGSLSLLTPDMQLASILPPFQGGLAFDSLRSLLYAVDTTTDEVVVLDVPSGQELFRVPLGEDVSAGYQETSINPDGRLFLSTPSGVRMLRPVMPGLHTVVLDGSGTDITDLNFGYRHAGGNRAPLAVLDTTTLNEDTPATVAAPGLLGNDRDPDGDPVTISLGQAPQHGQLVLNQDGSYTYTPNLNYNGADQFTYSLSDGSLTSQISTVTLRIQSINDAPTSIELNGNTVNENETGAVIGDLTVTDVEPGDTHTLTVSDERFEIVGQQLKLKSDQSLNFEAASQVTLEITATDQGGAALVATFGIDVSDVNEPPVLAISSNSINENAAGAVVGNVTVNDPDNNQNHIFTVFDNRFEITNGQLKVIDSESLDFETEPTIDVVVRVTDSGSPALSDSKTISVTVNNVNEAPTLTVPNQPAVDENSAGVVLGPVSVADDDDGQTHTLLVSDDRFEIVGGQLKLKDDQSLDHEAAATVLVEVTTQDSGTPAQSTTQTVSITVNNVNEPPSVALANATVNENAAGAVIGLVTITDPEQNQTHTVTLSDNRFEITGGQLKLTAGTALDHEAEATIDLDVTITDSGTPALNDQQTWTITVQDVDEAPTGINLSVTTVQENVAPAAIGLVTVSDPDAGDTHNITVSDNRFEVVAGELRLKVGMELDFETTPSINLTLTASDQDDPLLAFDAPFTITVSDINEPPIIAAPLADVALREYETLNLQLSSQTFQDPEGGAIASMNVSLAGGSPLPSWLTYDPASQTLSGRPLHADLGTLTVAVSGSDAEGLSTSDTFDIEVLASPTPYMNPVNPLDTSGGDGINATDVLLIINYINMFGIQPLQSPDIEGFDPPPYLDVSGDNFVAPDDVLLVINWINSQPIGEGEGSTAISWLSEAERSAAASDGRLEVFLLANQSDRSARGLSRLSLDDAERPVPVSFTGGGSVDHVEPAPAESDAAESPALDAIYRDVEARIEWAELEAVLDDLIKEPRR